MKSNHVFYPSYLISFRSLEIQPHVSLETETQSDASHDVISAQIFSNKIGQCCFLFFNEERAKSSSDDSWWVPRLLLSTLTVHLHATNARSNGTDQYYSVSNRLETDTGTLPIPKYCPNADRFWINIHASIYRDYYYPSELLFIPILPILLVCSDASLKRSSVQQVLLSLLQ